VNCRTLRGQHNPDEYERDEGNKWAAGNNCPTWSLPKQDSKSRTKQTANTEPDFGHLWAQIEIDLYPPTEGSTTFHEAGMR
jgi:hypothetical protein